MNANIRRIVMVFTYMIVMNIVASSYANEDLRSSTNNSNSIAINFEFFPGPDGIYGTSDDIPAPACPGSTSTNICNFPIDSYSNNRIKFSSGTPFQGNFFPDSDPSNHFISSSPLIASFSLPVNNIQVKSYSYWTAVLWAFDASNNVITSDVLVNPTQGNMAFLGKLKVSTNQPIAYFKVLAEGCPPSANTCDHILNLDDLSAGAAAPAGAAPIPALSPWAMLLLAGLLGALLWVALRRRTPDHPV